MKDWKYIRDTPELMAWSSVDVLQEFFNRYSLRTVVNLVRLFPTGDSDYPCVGLEIKIGFEKRNWHFVGMIPIELFLRRFPHWSLRRPNSKPGDAVMYGFDRWGRVLKDPEYSKDAARCDIEYGEGYCEELIMVMHKDFIEDILEKMREKFPRKIYYRRSSGLVV